MEEKEVLAKVADTIIQKPVTVTIDILNPVIPEIPEPPKETFITKVLIWLKIKKRVVIEVPEIQTKRTFVIKQAPLGVLILISKELIDVDVKAFKDENFVYRVMDEHAERMARIAAISVNNKREEPPRELVDFFLDNLISSELLKLSQIVIQQMGVLDFMSTILSIKSLNILRSPQSPEEIIASGEPLEV